MKLQSPAKCMLGWNIKPRLDLIRPSQAVIKLEVSKRENNFKEGPEVYVKDYKNLNKLIWKKRKYF